MERQNTDGSLRAQMTEFRQLTDILTENVSMLEKNIGELQEQNIKLFELIERYINTLEQVKRAGPPPAY